MIKARNFIIRTKEIIIFMERHVNNCDLCIGRMESDRLLMMEYDFDIVIVVVIPSKNVTRGCLVPIIDVRYACIHSIFVRSTTSFTTNEKKTARISVKGEDPSLVSVFKTIGKIEIKIDG